MKESTPVRWLEPGGDDAPDAVRRMLAAADRAPDPAAAERIWSAIATATAGAPVVAATSVGSMGLASKLVVAGLVLGAAGSVPWLLRSRSTASSPAVTRTVARRAEPAHETAFATQPIAPPPVAGAPVVPSPVHRPTMRPHPRDEALEPPAPAPDPLLVVPAAPSQPVAIAAAPAVQPVDELTLFDQIRSTLRRDPSRALSLADEHARRFPSGTFAQEREALAVDALASLGRRDEALVRADRFLSEYPGGTSAPRVREARDGLLRHDR